MPQIKIPFPIRGRDDSVARGSQSPDTTSEGRNFRGFDSKTGRTGQGARRPGSEKAVLTPLGAGPVRAIASVLWDQRHVLFEDLVDPEFVWEGEGPSGGNAFGIVHDEFGSSYTLEGGTHVAIRNLKGTLTHTILVPLNEGQIARAIAIDNLRRLYVGISEGGEQRRSKIIAFIDDPYRGWIVLWEHSPEVYVEKLRTKDGILYALANDTAANRSYVIAYRDISSAPQEEWRRQVTAPAGTFAISSDSGHIAVGSGFNPDRGLDPRAPGAGQILDPEFADWGIEDIARFGEKRWAVIDANSLELDDGEEVFAWDDVYGSQRRLFQPAETVHFVGIPGELRATGQPSNDEMITFTSSDGAVVITYRWRTAGTLAQAYDVAISAGTTFGSYTNLKNAMIGGGMSGVDYHQSTENNTLVTAGALVSLSAGAQAVLKLSVPTTSPYLYVDITETTSNMTAVPARIRPTKDVVVTAPKYRKVGMSGKPAVFYDGKSAKLVTNDNPNKLATAKDQQHSLIPAFGNAGNRDSSAKFALFLVCRPYESQATACVLAQKNDLWNRRIVANRNASGVFESGKIGIVEKPNGSAAVTYATSFISSGAAADLNFTLVEIVSYPSTTGTNDIEVYVNGTLLNSPPPDASANDGIQRTEIGQSSIASDDESFYYGEIQKIISLQADTTGELVTTAQRQLIEGMLAWEYGAQSLLPLGHPYQLLPPPPPGGSTANFNRAQRVLSTTPIVLKLDALSHDIAWVVASDNTTPATIGGLGYGVEWNWEGDLYSIGPPIVFSGPGADTASIRKIVDKGDDYSLDAIDGAWSDTLGIAPSQTETFTFDRFDLAVDEWNNVWLPFYADRYEGYPLQFLGYDVDGTLLLSPDAPEAQAVHAISIPPPPDFEGTSITRPEYLTLALRREKMATLTAPAVPPPGLSITLVGEAGTEVWTFASPVVNPGDVLLGLTPQETWGNFKAAINHAAGEGTLYGTGSVRSEIVTATTVGLTTLVLVQRRYESDTTAVSSGIEVTVSDSPFALRGSNVRQVKLVDTVVNPNDSRARVQVAECAGSIVRFVAPSSVAVPPGGTAALDPTARYIHSATLFSKVFFTDGVAAKVFDPRAFTVSDFTAEGLGVVPERARVFEAWNGRLVAFPFADDAFNWAVSEQGNAFGWDFDPGVLTARRATNGQLSDAGRNEDVINGWIPYSDDLAIIVGDHSLRRMTGNPAAPGARIDLITESVGGAFGRAWAIGPQGEIYLFGNTGSLLVMPPGGGVPRPLSERRVARLFEGIDLSKFHPELGWNWRYDGLDVLLCPYGGVSETSRSFFWGRTNNEFQEDTRRLATHQPTSLSVIDAEAPQDRKTLIGSADGYVRTWSDSAVDDDGSVIDSDVLIGPFSVSDEAVETLLYRMQVLIADASGPVFVEVYVSDDPTNRGPMRRRFSLHPGLSPVLSCRQRGGYVWIRLQSQARWVFESAWADMAVGSQRRRIP